MASVFKLGRDKRKKNAAWYFEYLDHNSKKRMKKGFTDKALTTQLANKMELESRQRRLGLIDADQEEQRDQLDSLVESHLSDYEKSLKAKQNTEKHVKLTMSRVRKITSGCEFIKLRDIRADDVETYLTELREEDEFGYRTYNHYLQAFDGWCNWMVSRRRLDHNPVAGIPRLNAELDIRHQRRALTMDEFGKLLKSARDSGVSIQCYDGEARARLYTLSYMTGLRRGELASLTPSSFDLGSIPPTVTVQAGASKHRRKDVLPLHPDLVLVLGKWLQGANKDEPLFPKLANRKAWLMVKKDLERIGIQYKSEKGIADFHAAGRHTHITELLRNGASLPEARELARHSDIRMTMKYTHISIEDQARAIRALPSCQDIVRNLGVPEGHVDAPTAKSLPPEEHGHESENPCGNRGYDAQCQDNSTTDKNLKKRRARDSNPQPVNRQLISNQPPHQFGYPPTGREKSSSSSVRQIAIFTDSIRPDNGYGLRSVWRFYGQ